MTSLIAHIDKTNLEKVIGGLAEVIEYIFSSIVGTYADRTAGDATTSMSSLAGFSVSAGMLMTGIVVYLFIKGFRKMLSGITLIAMALVLSCGSASVLLLALSPGTTILMSSDDYNATTFLNDTNFSSSLYSNFSDAVAAASASVAG
jgi:hypothetical protein